MGAAISPFVMFMQESVSAGVSMTYLLVTHGRCYFSPFVMFMQESVSACVCSVWFSPHVFSNAKASEAVSIICNLDCMGFKASLKHMFILAWLEAHSVAPTECKGDVGATFADYQKLAPLQASQLTCTFCFSCVLVHLALCTPSRSGLELRAHCLTLDAIMLWD